MESLKNKKNIAIITDSKNAVTETFIQNHIQYLPHKVFFIHGKPYPYIFQKKKRISIFTKLQYKIKEQNSNKNWFQLYKKNELETILKENKIELVIAEFLTNGIKILEVCKKLQIPIIVTALGYDISEYSLIKENKDQYKLLFNYCKNVVIVSNHMRKNLLELGCDEAKIVYSPAGPDEMFFSIQPDFKNQNIFALGRFVNKKAPHLSILAFNKVLLKHPSTKLIFGGDGPLLNAAKDLVQALKIEGNVVFLGAISQVEQMTYLENSLIFIQHSKTALNGDQEGTPVAILEAAAAGLPIVSTNHAGIPEVVKNGITGYLVDEGDIDGMANKIIELIEDKSVLKKMGSEGKSFVKNNFSLEKHIRILDRLIVNS